MWVYGIVAAACNVWPIELEHVGIFVKMEKIKYRVIIKYLILKCDTPTQIKDELNSMYEALHIHLKQ